MAKLIVGDGIIILMVIWIVCIVVAGILSREPGGMKAGAFGVIIVAVVITIILFTVPRGEPGQVDVTKIITVNNST